ncbi:MAG TPA: universal stress protein [Gallionella sp.]|jgi:nucleotide-binding universal stress UspA family protein|nr:universal stress protein [Gallionella sp.]
MKPLTRILTATDLSTPARHAVGRAFRIAAEIGARLDITHVISQSALDTLRRLLGTQASPVEQHILDEAREKLVQLAADFGQIHGLSAGIHVAAGTVLRMILDQADAMEADLLVLGARGEDYLSHLLLGTTAERLLRRTLRPVLMVKQTSHEPYRQVLVPVDFSPWSVTTLKLARTVAPQAELILLHAFEAPFESRLQYAGIDEKTINRYRVAARQESMIQLEAIVAETGLGPDTVRLSAHHGDASRVLLAQEQELDCDLIVMGKHGQGVVEELLLGSVTKHILSESACDVLVANHPASQP